MHLGTVRPDHDRLQHPLTHQDAREAFAVARAPDLFEPRNRLAEVRFEDLVGGRTVRVEAARIIELLVDQEELTEADLDRKSDAEPGAVLRVVVDADLAVARLTGSKEEAAGVRESVAPGDVARRR